MLRTSVSRIFSECKINIPKNSSIYNCRPNAQHFRSYVSPVSSLAAAAFSRNHLYRAYSVVPRVPDAKNADSQKSTTFSTDIHKYIAQVQQIQGTIGSRNIPWINRVSGIAAKLDSPFRITVVGERYVGVNDIVNALLEAPSKEPVLPEGLLEEHQTISRIRFGTDFEKLNSPVPEISEYACPATWLQNNQIEIFSIPGLDLPEISESAKNTVEDIIFGSDLIIMLTDPTRQLNGAWERQFLKRYVTKPNIVVAVTGLNELDTALIEKINANVHHLLNVEPSEESSIVFPVSIKYARTAQTLKSPSYEDDWAESGFRALKNQLVRVLSDSARRTNAKELSAAFTSVSALSQLEEELGTSTLEINRIQGEIQGNLEKWIEEMKARLYQDFEQRDLNVIEDSLAKWIIASREYFSKVSAIRLFLGTSMLSEDLKFKMTEHSLLEAEYRMTYSVGRLNEGLHTMFDQTRRKIDAIQKELSAKQDLSPELEGLKQDLVRVINQIDQIRPPIVEFDPYFLRNEVCKIDETSQCENLQKSADWLVRWNIYGQLGLVSSAMLLTHLGTPWAVSIPSTILASGLGFAWMSLRWKWMQDRFINAISRSTKGLKHRLALSYQKEFTRMVETPLDLAVGSVKKSIVGRLETLKSNDASVRSIKNSLMEKLGQ